MNYEISGVELDPPQLFAEIPVKELYEEFQMDKCMIRRDRVQGYYTG